MELLKKALLSIFMVIALLCVVGFMLPSDYKVERSITINAPSSAIFPYLVDLKKWQDWGVWFKRDPNMRFEYAGDQAAVGMQSNWISETEGNGAITIIALETNKRLIYSVSLPDMPASTGEFVLNQVEGVTQVLWLDYGDVGMNPFKRYLASVMDYLLGSDFEAGLDNLKMVAEAS